MSVVQNLIDQLQAIGITVGADRRQAMEAAAKELLASQRALISLQKGEAAPAFDLPNAVGEPIRLTDVLAGGPAVVTFYRGQWCPYCSRYLTALEGAVSEINALGARLLAISPQTPDNSLTTQEKLALSYEVLSDVGNVAAKRFGLVYRLPEEYRRTYRDLGIDLPRYNGTDQFDLPVPATYVIGADGVIASAYIDIDYTHRPEAAGILATLRELVS